MVPSDSENQQRLAIPAVIAFTVARWIRKRKTLEKKICRVSDESLCRRVSPSARVLSVFTRAVLAAATRWWITYNLLNSLPHRQSIRCSIAFRRVPAAIELFPLATHPPCFLFYTQSGVSVSSSSSIYKPADTRGRYSCTQSIAFIYSVVCTWRRIIHGSHTC